jgi:hypothetical protein
MAATNVQAFSGDVDISSNLAVNTDDLFVDTVNSRVGIGTTNPGAPLHLSTSGGLPDSISHKYLGVGLASGTQYVTLLQPNTSTQRLIGTVYGVRASTTQSNTFEAKVIIGTGNNSTIDAAGLTFKYIGTETFYGKLVTLTYDGNSYIALQLTPGTERGMTGGIYFEGKTSQVDKIQLVSTVTDVVDYTPTQTDKTTFSGTVGIGKTNPTGVNGGNRLEGSSTTGFEYIATRDESIMNEGDFVGGYLFKNTDTSGTSPHYAGMSAKHGGITGEMDLHFYSGCTNYEGDIPNMSIVDGNVGIGKTDPSCTLDVYGTSITTGIFSNRLWVYNVGDNSGDGSPDDNTGSPWFGLGYDNLAWNNQSYKYSGDIPILSGYNGVALRSGAGNLVLTSAGDVGIGTTDPQDELHLYHGRLRITQSSDSDGTISMYRHDTSGGPALNFRDPDGTITGWFGYGSSANNDIRMVSSSDTANVSFWTNNLRRMTIDASGDVGIGDATPDYKLHVNGSTKLGKTGVNTNPGNEGLRVYAGNYPAANFEALHSLGLISIVRASGSGGYNTAGGYNNNAVYRSDLASGSSGSWKHFTAVYDGNLKFWVLRDGHTYASTLENLGFDFKLGSGDQTSRGDTGLSRALVKLSSESLYINYSQDFEGGVVVQGSFSKGSGSFKIDHPLPEKEETHHLVHSFIEGPQADNLYRGIVQLVDGVSTVNIDETSRMTEGTFVALNRRTQCFTTNETDWDAVRGTLNGNILEIECQNTSSTATVSWLVIGERQDKHMFGTRWTDDEGRVITEPLKEFDYDDTDYLYGLRDAS